MSTEKAAESQVETGVSKAVAKEKITEMQADLTRQERTTGRSGAVPNATKQMLLDGSDAIQQNPGKRLRWVNVGVAEKVQLRKSQGYELVPVSEGGRQVGNLALFRLPEEYYRERVEALEKENKRRLSSHRSEVEQEAEAIARVLRDRHGIKAKILVED